MSDYNYRQYMIMIDCIHRFLGGDVNIGVCINDLKALIACLESPDERVRDALWKKWAVLEEVYAVSLDEGLMSISSRYEGIVQSALSEMLAILEGVVRECD